MIFTAFFYFCKMKKVEHIGIAVKDLNNANALFEKLFNQAHYKVEEVHSEGVSTSFFSVRRNQNRTPSVYQCQQFHFKIYR